MCIVIDMNVLPIILNAKHNDHNKYIDVHKWVTRGKGFIVFGGTHYINELRALGSYLGIISELQRKGRTRRLIDELVDKEELRVARLLKGSGCDDCHLIAIIRTSGCRLICSNDKRADKYLKNPKYYLKRQKPPHIYRDKTHKHLLCDKNICDIKNLNNNH